MADRRMFSKKITSSARFIKMPPSTQSLYFHLGQNADDDGVVEAYPVMKLIGATEDDLKVLIAKEFIIVLNEDLVSYITDWKEHNLIRADRKVDSIYKNLLIRMLPNIELIQPRRRADLPPLEDTGRPVDSIGKDSIGKDSIYINILCYLNEKAETKFKNIESNLKFIRARVQSGYTESDLKSVIDSKVKEWKGTDMQKYLRPETLFNATKFESYVNGLKGNIGNHNYNQKEYSKQELDGLFDNLSDVLEYVKENK